MSAFYNYITSSDLIRDPKPQFTAMQPAINTQLKSALSVMGQDTASKFLQPQQGRSLLDMLGLPNGNYGPSSDAREMGIPQIQDAQAKAPAQHDNANKPRAVPQGKYLASQQPINFAQAIAKQAGWF